MNQSRRLPILIIVLVLAAAMLPGCGGPTIYHLSGKVSFAGQPLPAGVIYFDPDYTQKNDGPQGYAFIKDGVYRTSAEGGAGVLGGPYLARIEGFDGQPGAELPLGRPLFTDFSQPLELPAADSVQNFEIPGN
ncbi:MAG: hypothetical protein L0211_22645 [Planctomycetaceae bacterium]|nr:hypothetical protein [Planctomycetaceae bacterium]